MRSVKFFLAAGAAALMSSAASAADMAIAPPPYAPPVIEDFGGWKTAQKRYFADGGLFDAIMAKKSH